MTEFSGYLHLSQAEGTQFKIKGAKTNNNNNNDDNGNNKLQGLKRAFAMSS